MSPVVEFSVDENAGSNPLKRFLAGGVQFLGLYVNCDAGLGVISWIFLKILCTGKICRYESRFKYAQAIFSRGCAVVGTFRKWAC